MSNQQIETVELSIEQARKLVDNRTDLEKLTKNKQFKNLIIENYFEREASRLVLLKADPSMQGDVEQATILRQIDAIGTFRQYLSTTMQRGNTAARTIADDEKTLEELRDEDMA